MESFELSKLINHYFIDYLFASEDFKYFKVKDAAYLNHDTIAYKEITNELLILQPAETFGAFRFYLWIINLDFVLDEPKDNAAKEDYLKQLKNKYFKKIMLTFAGQQNKQIDLKKDGSYENFPLNFQLNSRGDLIAFCTKAQIFVADLNKIADKDEKKEEKKAEIVLQVNQVRLENSNSSHDAVKWHPEVPTCLGVLFENKFYIYDVSQSLDSHDFHLSLSSKKKAKNAISFPAQENKGEEQLTFVDFTFCTKDNLSDLRYLAVFFLSTSGDIYYYSPILIPKLRIPEAEFQLKSKALLNGQSEDSRKYFERLFECIETNSQKKDGDFILKSVRHTQYENLSTENSIQGPLAKVDGGVEKTIKRRKDFVSFFRFPNKKGHIFATLRTTGKVSFLFSLNQVLPNSKKYPLMWDNEAPFKFAVIGKFQLPPFLPEIKTPAEQQILQSYNFVKNNTKMKFFNLENDGHTKVLLMYYNRVYFFHLEWADLIEKSLESKTLANKLTRREDFRTNCELILDNEAEPVPSNSDLKAFKPFNYGFYGLTLVKGNIFVINTNGEACDYNFIRVFTIVELRQIKEETIAELSLPQGLEEDKARFKDLFEANLNNQKAFKELISKTLPIYKKGEAKPEQVQKDLSDIDEYLIKVSHMKERIENSFAAQISTLIEVRQKQKIFFQKLQTRAKELYDKRETIEKVTFKRLIETNNFLKNKINNLVTQMRDVISPLSENDVKAREDLVELEKEIKLNTEKFALLKKRYVEIMELRKKNKENREVIQKQEVFGEFINKCKDIKTELKSLQEELSIFENN